MNIANRRRRGSKGEGWFWPVVILGTIALGLTTLIKVLPVIQEKGKLEDFMEPEIKRIPRLGHDGVMENINKWMEQNGYGFSAWDNCTLEGERGGPGRMECDYDRVLDFFGVYQYTMKVQAIKEVEKIPLESS